MRRLAFTFLLLATFLHKKAESQTVTLDSACAKAFKADVDTASKRYLKSTTLSAAQKRATGRLDGRTGALCQVVVNTPPPPSGPVARFTVTCDTARCTLDARSSSGAIDSFAWHASGGGRPDKTGSLITRSASSDAPNDWDETLTVHDSLGRTNSITQHVALLAPSTPPPTTPPPTQPPPSTNGSALAEAPRVVPVIPAGLDTLPCTVRPPAGTLPASAIRGGAVICISGTFGPTTIGPRTDADSAQWVVIRSDGGARLTPGERAGSGNASGWARFLADAGSAGLLLKGSRLYVTHVEVLPSPAAARVYPIVEIGRYDAMSVSQQPQDIAVVQTWIHGTPTTPVQRCVLLNSGATSLLDSSLDDCHDKGADSQAIIGWNGPGPYRIENNTLSGAGENIMFGGADPRTPGVIPSDITIRRNFVYTPAAWANKVWTKKTLLEFKAAQRVLIEANVFDGSWADGQNGWAITLKSANQGGACTWCAVSDISIRDNLIRNAASAVGISAQDPGVVGAPTSRVDVIGNVGDNLNTGVGVGSGFLIVLQNNVRGVQARGNVLTGAVKQLLNLEPNPAATDLTWADNVGVWGQYGIFCGGVGDADAALTGCTRGTLTNNGNTYIGPARSGVTGTWIASESASPLAAAIRARVTAATAGVVR